MPYEIGTAFIQVFPSFRNVDKELRKEVDGIAKSLEKAVADALPKGFEKVVRDATKRAGRAAEVGGDEAGEAFAGHFADTLRRRLSSGLKALPELQLAADSTDVERRLMALRKSLLKFRDERIGVDIDPGVAFEAARGFRDEFDKLSRSLKVDDIQLRMDLAQARDELTAWLDVVKAGGEQASRDVRRQVEERARIEQQALDEDERRGRKAIEAYSRAWDEAIKEDALRARRARSDYLRDWEAAIKEDALRAQRARFDYLRDWDAAIKENELRAQKARSDYLRDWDATIKGDALRAQKARSDYLRDWDAAIKENALRIRKARSDFLRDWDAAFQENARREQDAAKKAFGHTWAARVKENLEKAYKSLPTLDITPNSTPTEVALQRIREGLAELSKLRVGVDIDDKAAMRRIDALREQLTVLARTDPDIQVRTDTVQAAFALGKIQRDVADLDGRVVNIDVDIDGSGLDRVAQKADVSLSRLESLIAVGVSLGTILVPAATAAAGAVGFIGTSAVSATAGLGVMVLGFSGIGAAVQALEKQANESEKEVASLARSGMQVAAAGEAIASAERSLANVRANNADAARRAARSVEEAERSVARAQQAARQASLDLVRAREAERRAAQDLAFDLQELVLAQERANLDQIEAKKKLDKLMSNPRATEEQRKQARIAYDEIGLRIEKMAVEQERLTERQEHAAKVGVEGSDRVLAAHERVAAATEGIAAAERRRAEASRAQQSQQRQAVFALASAQQSLAAAHRQAEQAVVRGSVAGGEALDNLNEAMEELTPTGQRFARWLFGLKGEFLALRASASDPMLPGVQQSITELLPKLPGFRRYVSEVAGSVGDLFVETSRFLSTDRTWRRFWSHTDQETVPTMERLYRIGRNTTTGLLGLYLALTPFNDDVGGGLENLTARFDRWAASLEHSATWVHFLDYIRDNGPRVVNLLGELGTFVLRFLEASAPIGSTVLPMFTGLVELLNAIPLPILTALIGLMGLYSLSIVATNTASRLAAINESVRARVTQRVAQATGLARSTQLAYNLQMQAAIAHTGTYSSQLTRLGATAKGLSQSGMGGLVGMLGGPLGIALTAASIATVGIITASAEYQSQVNTLTTALGGLGSAYDKITESGRRAAAGTDEQIKGIIQANPELQKAVVTLSRLGVGFDTFASAATGNVGDMQTVLAALDAEIDGLGDQWRKEFLKFWNPGTAKATNDRMQELRQLREAILTNADALGVSRNAQELMNAEQSRANTLSRAFSGFIGPVSIDVQRALGATYDANADRIRALTGLTTVFGNTQSTAADKADALRAAIDQQTGSAKSAIEQQETWSRVLLDLSGSVQANGKSLSLQSQEGLRNRDALQAAAAAARDLYLADIEAGKPMEEVTEAHRNRITELAKVAKELHLNERETRRLIAAYGDVPEDVQTVYETKGFAKVYRELEELQFAQYALAQGMTPKQALQAWTDQQNAVRKQRAKQHGNLEFGDGYGVTAGFFRDGGMVRGKGTGTSDSNLAWVSNREFVQPRASVDYYGQGLMEAIRHRLIPRDMFPGFASGGLVQWPISVNAAMTRLPSLDEVLANTVKGGTPSSGGIGSANMMRILRAAFPGLALHSGYRPGSRTLTGNRSYHSMIAENGNPGRAVDVPPRMDVFDWIRVNYPNSRELIFSPAGGRQVWNGRPHMYREPVRGQHWDHVHWAFDQGGWLPEGWSTVFNGTGQPEPVFTSGQWDQLSAAVRINQADPRGVEHHWHFREAKLDLNRLQAWQDRQNALARVGRPD